MPDKGPDGLSPPIVVEKVDNNSTDYSRKTINISIFLLTSQQFQVSPYLPKATPKALNGRQGVFFMGCRPWLRAHSYQQVPHSVELILITEQLPENNRQFIFLSERIMQVTSTDVRFNLT
ncbi:hypothetical protein GCM10028773_51800 [Spirosoma koreense]